MDFKTHLQELEKADPELCQWIYKEIERQQDTIELIASENIVSAAVLEAQGTVLTNKYAEGYPGKRYYGGNQFIDKVEQLAIDRAKLIFGAEHVNVQSHSGSSANAAVYLATLKPQDTVLAINLDMGGHLTHGHKLNFSGQLYNFVQYTLNKDTLKIDYADLEKVALEKKPKMIVTGYSAYPGTIDFVKFKAVADKVGAILFADISHIAGLVAAGVHTSPFPHCDIVMTTTHKTLRGPRGAIIMSKQQYGQAIDKAVFPGSQGGPLEHVIAAKAVAFKEALTPEFKQYQKQVVLNAKAMAKSLVANGITVVGGGTENHLMLVDLRNVNLKGKEAEHLLDEVGICTNKNMIPFDTASPLNPSGLRLGTPAITSRGFKEKDAELVGVLISKLLKAPADVKVKEEVAKQAKDLCRKFPIYK